VAKIQLTQEGLEALQAELTNLKEVKRVEIAEKLKVAISYGDLSENSEYQEARDDQSNIEMRITEVEEQLNNHEIIKADHNTKKKLKANIGNDVTLEVERDGKKEKVVYHIVGTTESDIFSNKISNETPIGAALIGKSTGDTIEGESPAGKFSYKVIKVA